LQLQAILTNRPAAYISKRCGDTTVEVSQVSTSSKSSGSSRSRSKQLSRRSLILPHEVLQMRSDEQIVFTAGNPPIRCGRAIWFRRKDMRSRVDTNRFEQP
jgi:type IV secretion system protein VirD4